MDSKHIDILIERPHVIKIGNKPIYFYPQTLGKSHLLARLVTSLEINSQALQQHTTLEILRVVSKHRETVVRILSYHASYSKKQIFDVVFQERQCKRIASLSDAGLASLFMVVMNMQEPCTAIMKALDITRKQKTMEKIRKAKDDSSTVIVGGASIYGQLIDAAAERYGWTYDYIVWGVSLTNLQLMLADKVDSIYMTKEERKKARLSDDNTIINADDPKNRETIKKLLSN